MRPLPNPVRRSDVARAADVAPATVSLVLNRHPGLTIPESTRKRIFDAAERLGYRPSHVARSLSSGRTHTVGVAVHYMVTPFQLYTAGVLNGVWSVIGIHQYRMLLGRGAPDCGGANLYRDKCVDGLLVLAPPLQPQGGELEAILQAGFPTVLVGASLPEDPLDYVDVDNAAAAHLATRTLIEAGHRRIAHITGPLDLSSAARLRLEGYRNALMEAGLPVDPTCIATGNWSSESGRTAMEELLRREAPFTAVFAANDGMANCAIEALRAAGRQVPRDCAVIGVDGFSDHPLAGIALTTVAQPLEAIGRAAAERLLARIAGSANASPPCRLFLRGKLSPGVTVAPPRA